MTRLASFLVVSFILFAGMAVAQQHVQHLDVAFGAGATEWADGAYQVKPTAGLPDAEAVRELVRVMNRAYITPGTRVRLYGLSDTPLVEGTKDAFGQVELRWLEPPPPPLVTPPRPAVNPPRTTPPGTWGVECTSYQTGNTTGVRCRDSSGRTWGNECTSYQSGNTTGVRCREW